MLEMESYIYTNVINASTTYTKKNHELNMPLLNIKSMLTIQ